MKIKIILFLLVSLFFAYIIAFFLNQEPYCSQLSSWFPLLTLQNECPSNYSGGIYKDQPELIDFAMRCPLPMSLLTLPISLIRVFLPQLSRRCGEVGVPLLAQFLEAGILFIPSLLVSYFIFFILLKKTWNKKFKRYPRV